MFIRAGGNPETLEKARARAKKRLELWLQSQRIAMMTMSDEVYASAITTLTNIVSSEIGNVAMEIQEAINQRVRAINPTIHDDPTTPVAYVVCPQCASRREVIPPLPRRDTADFGKVKP